MKKQITFEGERADDKAIEWLGKLALCFHIKRAKIIEIKKETKWEDKKVRLEVRYE